MSTGCECGSGKRAAGGPETLSLLELSDSSIVILRRVVDIATNRAGCGSGIAKLEGVVARLTMTDQKMTSGLSWLVVMACSWSLLDQPAFSKDWLGQPSQDM